MRLTDQKFLRLLRAMTPLQTAEYHSRLQRGFEETRIRRSAVGSITIYMEKHDARLGNFAIAIYPDGSVRGGRIAIDGTVPDGVKRFTKGG